MGFENKEKQIPEKHLPIVSKWVKCYRKILELTQEEFAEMLGIEFQLLFDIEHEKWPPKDQGNIIQNLEFHLGQFDISKAAKIIKYVEPLTDMGTSSQNIVPFSRKDIASWIRYYLGKRGWTPRELAKRARIDEGTLSRILNESVDTTSTMLGRLEIPLGPFPHVY